MSPYSYAPLPDHTGQKKRYVEGDTAENYVEYEYEGFAESKSDTNTLIISLSVTSASLLLIIIMMLFFVKPRRS
jgi:hypothetical protein